MDKVEKRGEISPVKAGIRSMVKIRKFQRRIKRNTEQNQNGKSVKINRFGKIIFGMGISF